MTSRLLVFCTWCLCATSALDLPDLRSVFGSFYERTHGQRGSSETNSGNERVKRQDPGIGDESQLHYLIKASRLPPAPGTNEGINPRYMPTLGNGHLATTVYDDSIYLNGLYSGNGSDSHRARIPARIMSKIKIAMPDLENRATRKYILNAKEGYFMETIDCEFAYIEHRIYIHKYFIRVLVSDIYWRTKSSGPGGGNIELSFPNFTSEDIEFGSPRPHYAHYQITGTTRQAEETASTQTVHAFWMLPVEQIAIQPSKPTDNYTVVMAIDRQESSARAEFDECLRILGSPGGNYELLRLHTQAWEDVWSQGSVMVEGDTQLAKITTFAQYYLLSSLPTIEAYQPPQHSEFLYGVGRNSLAKGSLGKDYHGHVLWDSEVYILPAIVFFHPELAKRALRYRTAMGAAAQEIAEAMGSKGYKYPYRSAYSGREVGSCLACDNRKLHTSGAVSWGIRQYYSATRDRDYLINADYVGCDITREVARLFADQSVYDPETGRYDIRNVTGPDETYPFKNNNAYTLAMASLAIHWARYMACECQRNERDEVPDEWVQMAMYYNLPYDNVARLHYQFEGFENIPAPRINQSDAIMLTFPLNWNVSRDIMRNDLEYYEQITSDLSPALTWSFFTVGWKWVQETAKMNSFFLKSYQDYLIQPFKIWTEFNEASPSDQNRGSVNFLPGMGGFLQSLIYGFAGIRLRPQSLEFHDPKPPQGIVRIRLNGLKYLGTSMSITIEEYSTVIVVHEVGDFPLVLRRNGTNYGEESLNAGGTYTIDRPDIGFFIYTHQQSGCEHPRDYIYMPWGYSPFVDGASGLHLTALQIYIALFLSTFSMTAL